MKKLHRPSPIMKKVNSSSVSTYSLRTAAAAVESESADTVVAGSYRLFAACLSLLVSSFVTLTTMKMLAAADFSFILNII
jgi:hypothetical protein